MSNRLLNQFQYTYEKDTVTIYGSVSVGASGAVSAIQGGGIAAAAKESTAGQYTITMSDKFSRLLDFSAQIVDDANSAVAHIQLKQAPETLQADVKGDKQILIQCLDYAGSAANPADGSAIFLKIVMRNSSVGPYDS